MLEGQLTHVSTVQTWECDSNSHLNVQFFHQRFREAGTLFRLRHGLDDVPMATAHTRFFRELHVDDAATVMTLPVHDSDGAVYLMHRLTVDGTTLNCGTLDRLRSDASHLDTQPLADFPDAAPRGLDTGPIPPLPDTAERIRGGRGAVTCITHVLPSDMDHAGAWRAERLVSSFSNGGQSAWALLGATSSWLRERSLGRVVLEMKFDCIAQPRPGAVLSQSSHCIDLGSKTYRFCHQIEDAVTGELYAVGQVLSVLMDLKTRKVVPIPDALALPGAA
ncbi:hypothetical protein BOO69_03015 [Sulfitobacter alexandrii]|uniref:Thioesterase n=1 Tax=Sulfitobacter alexandrii TaxID=1917485 RepID=A0A1J0WDW9_9RHOB|nr:thioesterase family protein [Sulfitobacter alexandrii]APE42499.1 hypothetical protein BOO69_03015 [Sulfitobacter alexandrii]